MHSSLHSGVTFGECPISAASSIPIAMRSAMQFMDGVRSKKNVTPLTVGIRSKPSSPCFLQNVISSSS